MGICNLKRIDEYIRSRKQVHDRYFERLSGVDGLILCPEQKDVIHNYAYFPIYFDREKFGKSRDDVFAALREKDIYSRKYFYPAVNDMECYRDAAGKATPVAHDVSMNILTVPMYEGLAMEDVDRICDIILS